MDPNDSDETAATTIDVDPADDHGASSRRQAGELLDRVDAGLNQILGAPGARGGSEDGTIEGAPSVPAPKDPPKDLARNDAEEGARRSSGFDPAELETQQILQ